METFRIKNLTFTYPEKTQPALRNVSLEINMGELVVLCGRSGCGKTTLLRNLKPLIAPHGSLEGTIEFYGRDVRELSQEQQASKIGYVLQNPDSQIVTDKVWHELAFGLENLGLDTRTIRLRVAEMASFFGIQGWFHKNVSELSGGQKQLLNLASVMAMQPEVLILDEPTTGLDPNQLVDIRGLIKNIGKDKTVFLSTHIMQEVEAICDRVIIINKGKIVEDYYLNDDKNVVETQVLHVEFDKLIDESKLYISEVVDLVKNLDGNLWELHSKSQDDIRPIIFDFASANDLKILSMQRQNKNLETIFREKTQENK